MRLLEGLGVGITASGLAVVVGLFITSSVGVNWLVHSFSFLDASTWVGVHHVQNMVLSFA